MLIAILFWLMTLTACGYAVILGGWEGKWTTGFILSASAITFISERLLHLRWRDTNTLMFAVDVLMLVGMYIVAAKSQRWWPIWVAAFQLNSVAAHVATVISPAFTSAVYHGFEGLWAFPGQIVMVFGIWRDRSPRRRRQSKAASEPDEVGPGKASSRTAAQTSAAS